MELEQLCIRLWFIVDNVGSLEHSLARIFSRSSTNSLGRNKYFVEIVGNYCDIIIDKCVPNDSILFHSMQFLYLALFQQTLLNEGDLHFWEYTLKTIHV